MMSLEHKDKTKESFYWLVFQFLYTLTFHYSMRGLFSPLLINTVSRSCELCCRPSDAVGSKMDDTASGEVVVGQCRSDLMSSSLSHDPSSLNVRSSSLSQFVCLDFSWWFRSTAHARTTSLFWLRFNFPNFRQNIFSTADEPHKHLHV